MYDCINIERHTNRYRKTTLDKINYRFHHNAIPYEIVKREQYVTARYLDHDEYDSIHNRCNMYIKKKYLVESKK